MKGCWGYRSTHASSNTHTQVTARASASASHAAPALTKAKRARFVRALLPNPELWTASLRHRTQICQDLDQAMVVFMLGLRPGKAGIHWGLNPHIHTYPCAPSV